MSSSPKPPLDQPMSMPGGLPPELWHRVFTYLDPYSLSCACQVNSAFHEVATEERLFRHQLAPHMKGSHAAQIYRRFEALHYPTTRQVSIHSSARTQPFAIVNNTLLLSDFERSRFITFPNGRVIPSEFSDDASCPWDYLTFPDEKRSFVVLPGHHIGFMYDRAPTMFAVMNVVSGDLWTYPVPGDRFPERKVCFGEPFLPAGSYAEWVAHYVDDGKLVLVDWRSGEIHKEISTASDVKYAMAECPSIDANCLVGVVHVREKGFEKEVLVKGFDGEDDTFSIDGDRTLLMMLRSANKRTNVLITSNVQGYDEKVYFQVRRMSKGNKPECWGGELNVPGYPEIRDNGRVLACRCESYSPRSSFLSPQSYFSQLWIEIDDASSWKAAEVPKIMIVGTLVWTRRTKDGGFAVFTENESSIVLTKFCNVRGSFTPARLRSWIVKNMISVHVVADHYIVVQKRDGKIIIIHFDWFCEGATGVYACPGFVHEENDEYSEKGMDLTW